MGGKPLVEDTYSRSVLPFVLQTRGWQVIHASGVQCPTGIAVFCGVSGVGKSTLQFGLTQRGYPPWADDAVAFMPDAYISQSLRLPFRVRLLSNSIQYFQLNSPPPPASTPFDNMKNHLAPIVAIFILSRARCYPETSQSTRDCALESQTRPLPISWSTLIASCRKTWRPEKLWLQLTSTWSPQRQYFSWSFQMGCNSYPTCSTP